MICFFLPCRWQHIAGRLYQCTRCKTISLGAYRERPHDGS
jgi:hypothetical protein